MPGSLRALLQRHARRRKLLDAEAQLGEADLRRAVALLEAQAVAAEGGELRIDYDGLAQVGGGAGRGAEGGLWRRLPRVGKAGRGAEREW